VAKESVYRRRSPSRTTFTRWTSWRSVGDDWSCLKASAGMTCSTAPLDCRFKPTRLVRPNCNARPRAEFGTL